MKKLILVALLLLPSLAYAQVPQATSSQKFAWDQDVAASENIPALMFKYYTDGATTGVILTGVVCTGTAPTLFCSVPIPAFTPGTHSIKLSAINIAGESALSVPFDFALVVTPSAPRLIRVIK